MAILDIFSKEIPITFESIVLPDTFVELEKTIIDFSYEEAEQEKYKAINKKYYQLKDVITADTKKRITEYVCPNGEVGYQIIVEKKIGEDWYQMSTGYGQEGKERTFSWREIIKE